MQLRRTFILVHTAALKTSVGRVPAITRQALPDGTDHGRRSGKLAPDAVLLQSVEPVAALLHAIETLPTHLQVQRLTSGQKQHPALPVLHSRAQRSCSSAEKTICCGLVHSLQQSCKTPARARYAGRDKFARALDNSVGDQPEVPVVYNFPVKSLSAPPATGSGTVAPASSSRLGFLKRRVEILR